MNGWKLFRERNERNDNNNMLYYVPTRLQILKPNTRTFMYTYIITHLCCVFSFFIHALCIIYSALL